MQPDSSRKKSSKIKRRFIFFFFTTFLLGALLFGDYYFKIKKVEVSSKDIEKVALNPIIGENIIFLNSSKVEDNLLDLNPDLEKVELIKQFPDVVILKTQKAIPRALLVADQGYFYLNLNGRIIKKSKEKDTELPTINYYQKLSYSYYSSGDFISFGDIKATLLFIDKIGKLGIEVDNVDISGLNMIRLNLDKGVVLVTTEKDINTQIYQLEKIIKQFKVEGKQFETLDLRFDKPIVKIK